MYALASERHSQTTALASIRDKVVTMKASVEEARELLSFDKFRSAEGLNYTVAKLKVSFVHDTKFTLTISDQPAIPCF